jgi:hypothetical protein
MGFWFFLSVLVGCRFLYKSYKLRLGSRMQNQYGDQAFRLEREISDIKKLLKEDYERRVAQLEEQVFFGDFELNRQFDRLNASVRKNPEQGLETGPISARANQSAK